MKPDRGILADNHLNMLGAIRNLPETETKTVLMLADEASRLHGLEPDAVVSGLSLPFSSGTNIGRALENKFPSQLKISFSVSMMKNPSGMKC